MDSVAGVGVGGGGMDRWKETDKFTDYTPLK